MASTGRTIVVTVGSQDGNTLAYTPNTITAAAGDFVQFQFVSGNHTATRSGFADACVPIASGGFHSGFNPAAAALDLGMIATYTLKINDTDPIAFYCAQGSHCQNGMVGVINPSGAKSLANLLAAAAAAPNNVAPGSEPPRSSSTSSAASTGTGGTRPTSSLPTGSPSPGQQNGSGSGNGNGNGNGNRNGNGANGDDTGFSRGAQAGVGIGVAVALVAVAALVGAWFLLRRRRRRRRAAAAGAARLSASYLQQKLELEAIPAAGGRAQVSELSHELPQKSELEAKSYGRPGRSWTSRSGPGSVYELDGRNSGFRPG